MKLQFELKDLGGKFHLNQRIFEYNIESYIDTVYNC